MTVVAKALVKRGQESWTYIYIMMGFALSIEAGIIGMTPLHFSWNLAAYGAVGALTVYLFTSNGWFQDKLIGFKNWYETKAR